jgi:hypothetical protein
VAERIVCSGLHPHELETLWRSQVTPVVHWNLKQSGGEWCSFDRRWLLLEVTRRAGKAGLETWPWVGPFVHRIRAHGAEREFRLAQALAARLARVSESERPRRVALWQALFQVYYAVDAAPPPEVDESGVVQFSHRIAQRLIERQQIEPSELLEEFRASCDLMGELLSSVQKKRVAEAHVAGWFEHLGFVKR